MINRILVPLDPSPFSHAATLHACRIAEASGASVTGLVILDLPDIEWHHKPIHAVALQTYQDAVAAARHDAAGRIRETLDHFGKTCATRGVPHHEAECQGLPADTILRFAGYYDLVIMGLRTYFQFETQEGPGNSLSRVLQHTTCPVLAVPKHRHEAFESPLLAFDGSPNALRALHALADLHTGSPLKQVTILTSDDDEHRRSFLLKQAAAYLRAYGIPSFSLVDTARDVRAVIEEDYLERVDLIALGVHARHPFKDFLVGSLTESLIEFGHMPLLLAQ